MPGAASIKIEVSQDTARLQKALRVLAEPEAPYLTNAMDRAGRLLERASESRAKGGIAAKIEFAGVKGKPYGLRATVVVKHPGAKPMEFGRQTYYRGFTDRRMKATGTPFKAGRGGQKADPYIGIVNGDAALGAVGGQVREIIAEGISAEWARIEASV